ncbi:MULTISPECIES: hypothetical protein [Asaia]|uniref:Uncharacterized protein n=1 Tax=Asaia bogorensis TaxID=91915 RepID=A0A060QFB4_9PROT|nr:MULTISPECIES: hypothetical protein [Asaia]ETD00079.1 hypothetical protein P792_00535 [Asaia sp. SF2.1]CDG39605.1 hypothetical protein ASAP_1560 [Asaia bogorensis]
MKEAPANWTAIAVTLPKSNALTPIPGAFATPDAAILRDDVETRYATEGKRRVMQARKKGGR